MRSRISRGAALVAAALFVALGGCQSPAPATGPAPPTTTNASGGMGMSQADMTAMCAGMHQEMMGAKSPEERRAIMQKHMAAMSPEMQQRMHEHMRSMSPEMREKMHGDMGAMCR